MKLSSVGTALVIVFSLFVLTGVVLGGEKEDYFRKFVERYGVEASTISDLDEGRSNVLLLLTSKLGPQELPLEVLARRFKFTILICDSYYVTTGFTCSSSSIFGDVGKSLIHNSALQELDLYAYWTNIAGTRVEIIPEQELVDPNSMTRYGEYIRSVLIAERLVTDGSKDSLGAQVDKFIAHTPFVKSFTLVSLYSFLATLLYLSTRNIRKDKFSRFYQNFKGFFARNYSIFLYLSAVVLLMFPPAMYAISIIDRGFFSPRYMAEYLLESLNFLNLRYYFENQEAIRLGVFYLFLTFLILFFSALISRILNSIEIVLGEIMAKKFNKRYVKLSLVVMVPFVIFGLVNSSSAHLANLSTFLIFVIIYFTYLLAREGTTPSRLYTTRERYRIVLVFLAIVSLSYLSSRFLESLPKRYKSVDLVREESSVVILPYYREYLDGEKFSSLIISPNVPIFVDNTLVYHPRFNKVINRSVSNFVPSGSLIMTSNNIDNMINPLIKNTELRKMLTDNSAVSPIFYIEDANTKNLPLYMEYTVDCGVISYPLKVPGTVYFEGVSGTELVQKTEKITFMAFPGCEKENGQVTYKTTLDLPENLKGLVVFKLSGLPLDGVTSLRIFLFDSELPIMFVKPPSDTDLVFERIIMLDEIVSYNFSNDLEIEFPSSSGEFDLSTAINILKDNGRLLNPFKIWTPYRDTVIIKNTLNE